MQWPNEKVQKNKQRSTKYTHKTKDRQEIGKHQKKKKSTDLNNAFLS